MGIGDSQIVRPRIILGLEGTVSIHDFRREKIAIVEGDQQDRNRLAEILKTNGFIPTLLSVRQDWAELLDQPEYDLAIISMIGESARTLKLVRSIREKGQLPVILMGDGKAESDPVAALDAGADDFLYKPLNDRELAARIRAVLRRYGREHRHLDRQNANLPDDIRIFGAFRISGSQRRLFDRGGDEVPLTNSEYRLLEFFLENPKRVIPRVELLQHLGSDCSRYVDRSVDVLVLRLRRKIEACPSRPVYLQTRRGKGYVFVAEILHPQVAARTA